MLWSRWKARVHADEVVECLFPIDGSGWIGVLRCCIDASEREGVFTVAAVGYGLDRAKKANREWTSALKGRAFHMTDLNARKGGFAGIDDAEVDKIMRATVGAVASHASFITAVSCELDDVRDHLPKTAAGDDISREMLKAVRSPYGLMCHLCMVRASKLVSGKREIDYVLEAGDHGQRGLIAYLDHIEQSPISAEMREAYSFRRKSVGTKEDIEGIFHSADLVAWEWGKQVQREAEGKPKRKSFERIEGAGNVGFRHFGRGQLDRFLDLFRDLLDATEHEQVNRALLQWRETG